MKVEKDPVRGLFFQRGLEKCLLRRIKDIAQDRDSKQLSRENANHYSLFFHRLKLTTTSCKDKLVPETLMKVIQVHKLLINNSLIRERSLYISVSFADVNGTLLPITFALLNLIRFFFYCNLFDP